METTLSRLQVRQAILPHHVWHVSTLILYTYCPTFTVMSAQVGHPLSRFDDMQVLRKQICAYRGLKDLIKEAQQEMEQQGTVAFSPRTTSLTVTRPRGQKPADERFFEKLENEARTPIVSF